jgi:hypothetical protein
MSKKTLTTVNSLLGKEVQIYPGDTNGKRGIIQDITPAGILFLITAYNGNDQKYIPGNLHFIAYSNNLHFREVK